MSGGIDKLESDIKDLTNYFVVKKYTDGWLVRKNSPGEQPIFLQNDKLVAMGYLNKDIYQVDNTEPTPSIIMVPTIKRKSRADLDDNWRRK
jgi:hypothetical protein